MCIHGCHMCRMPTKELKLQRVISHHVGSGNKNWLLCKSHNSSNPWTISQAPTYNMLNIEMYIELFLSSFKIHNWPTLNLLITMEEVTVWCPCSLPHPIVGHLAGGSREDFSRDVLLFMPLGVLLHAPMTLSWPLRLSWSTRCIKGRSLTDASTWGVVVFGYWEPWDHHAAKQVCHCRSPAGAEAPWLAASRDCRWWGWLEQPVRLMTKTSWTR